MAQGSDHWGAWRARHVGASEASQVSGDSAFGTPLELWQLKTGRRAPEEVNEDMKRGHDLEPFARAAIEQHRRIELQQLCIEHASRDFISASLDGFNAERGEFWEIKAPRIGSHLNLWKYRSIGKWYRAQMTQQAAVIRSHVGASRHLKGFFASYVSKQAILDAFGLDDIRLCPVPHLIIVPFELDPHREKLLTELVENFWGFVERDEEPTEFEAIRARIFGDSWEWKKKREKNDLPASGRTYRKSRNSSTLEKVCLI